MGMKIITSALQGGKHSSVSQTIGIYHLELIDDKGISYYKKLVFIK